MWIMTTSCATVQARGPLAAYRLAVGALVDRKQKGGGGQGGRCLLVPLAAEPRRRCHRAARAAGVAAPWWERPYKLVAAGRSPAPSWTENKRAAAARAVGAWLVLLAADRRRRGALVDRKQKGGGGGQGGGAWLVPLTADRRSRCHRAVRTVGVAAPSRERACKLVALDAHRTRGGAIVDRKREGDRGLLGRGLGGRGDQNRPARGLRAGAGLPSAVALPSGFDPAAVLAFSCTSWWGSERCRRAR